MDLESFEIYGLEKGFRFNKIVNDEEYNLYGLGMKKPNRERTEYLTNYQKYYGDAARGVTYQGPIQEKLVSIYKELKSLGFEMYDMSETENNGKTYFLKEYIKNGGEVISIYIFPDGLTCEITYEYKL